MTRIITTPKCLLVEVPEGAAIFRLIGNAETGYYLEVYDKNDFGLCTIDLPPASYGDPILASEMDAMQKFNVLDGWPENSITQFASLLRAHSLKPETTCVIPIN